MSNIFVGTVQIKGKTAAAWASLNPVLLAREPGLETDTAKVKYGDGISAWSALPYSSGGSSSSSAAVSVAFSTTIPLDTNGAGKVMPETSLTSNFAFSVGLSPVSDGTCQLCMVGDGTHTPDLTSFTNGNGYTYSSALNARNLYVFGYQYGSAIYAGVLLPSTSAAPVLSSAAVSDSDATKIQLVWSKAMDSNISAAAAFAVSSGHVLTTHTRTDSTHSYLTTSTPFIQTESAKTLSYTQPGANQMKDSGGTLVANFAGVAVSNNVTNPQITGAAVSNSTPTKIDLTWSDTILSTSIPAPAAFAVSSGHALTTHVYVDSTHSQLTTSSAFVAGETKTLSYAVPGSNPIVDLSTPANLGLAAAAVSITDNVISGSSTTLVQTSGLKKDNNNTTGTKTFTAASNFTAGNTVILTLASANAGGDIVSVTVSGTSATKDKTFQSLNNNSYWINIWRAQSITGGNANVVITYANTTASYAVCSFEEWANMPAAAFDASASGENDDAGSALNLTTGAKAQSKEIVYAAVVSSQVFVGATIAGPTSGYTQTALQTTAGDIGGAMGYKTVNAAGTESAGFTTSFHDLGGVVATYKAQ